MTRGYSPFIGLFLYMPSNTQSTNFRGGLTAQSTVTLKQEYLTSTGGALNINGGGSGGGSTQYSSGTTTPSPVIGNALIYDNAGTLQNVSVANPLPVTAAVTITGVATSANQTNATQKTQIVDGSGNVISSTSNALNTNITNSSIAVTGTFFQATQPVSLTSTTITGTVAVTESGTWNVGLNAGSNAIGSITNTSFAATQATASSLNATVVGTGTFATQVTSLPALTAGTNVIGHVIADTGSTTAVTGTVTTKETRSTTPSQTSVSVANTNTSILASNSNRLGFTAYNEGTAICYLKLGSTASTTSYTIQIVSGGYYECPFNYTGAVDGITSSSTAQLRVTELT